MSSGMKDCLASARSPHDPSPGSIGSSPHAKDAPLVQRESGRQCAGHGSPYPGDILGVDPDSDRGLHLVVAVGVSNQPHGGVTSLCCQLSFILQVQYV